MGNAIAIFDANQRLDFANNAYANLFGIDNDWLAEKPVFGDILDRQREARTLPEADFQMFRRSLVHTSDASRSPLS